MPNRRRPVAFAMMITLSSYCCLARTSSAVHTQPPEAVQQRACAKPAVSSNDQQAKALAQYRQGTGTTSDISPVLLGML